MISPENLELIQKGGMLVLLLIAIGWLVIDRNRLLKSLSDKDEAIAEKDEKLLALSTSTIQTMTEFKGLLQMVVDMLNVKRR